MTALENYLPILENPIIIMAGLCAISLCSFLIAKRFLGRGLNHLICKANPSWAPVLEEHKPFRQLTYMVPVLFFYFGLQYFPETSQYLNRIINSYIIINIVMMINAILVTGGEVYRLYPISKKKPIKSYIQLLSLFIYIVGGVIATCVLLDKSPWAFISSIGALTALILLVFRETILSFIAGMQIVANNLIEKDDWIEVPAFGADGAVIDVALHVIKVQNWDKTIVTIPTYKVIESGFKNWRGMYESGGRRIKRDISIDQTSVKFMSDQEITNLFKLPRVQKYLGKCDSLPETNLGMFRKYVESYLDGHPKITNEMTFIIRLLQPTATGVPLEVYVFANDTAWANYENIQGEIFEHLMAILPQFGLRIFQNPSGYDFDPMVRNLPQEEVHIPSVREVK